MLAGDKTAKPFSGRRPGFDPSDIAESNKNLWMRGGEWSFFDDPFLYPDQAVSANSPDLEAFSEEMNRVRELFATPVGEVMNQVRERIGFHPSYSTDDGPVTFDQPSWEEFSPYKDAQAVYWVDLMMSWLDYEELLAILHDHRNFYYYLPRDCATLKVNQDDSTLEWYDPMEDTPKAYLDYANIVNDIWNQHAENRDTTRRSKLLEFFKDYGPPVVFREDDLDLLVSGLTDRELQARVVEETRVHALIRSSVSSPLPKIYRCFYVDAIRYAMTIALTLRCYQAVYEDWDTYQPALKQFLLSPEAEKLFNDHYKIAGTSIAIAGRLDDLDSDEVLKKYLVQLLSNGHYWEANKMGNYHVDEETGGIVKTVVYSDLLTMLWAQLSETIEKRIPVRRCDECETPFNPVRSDQKYCSKECRSVVSSRAFNSPTRRAKRAQRRIDP